MFAFCCSSVYVRLRLQKQEKKIVQKYQMRYTRAQLIFYFSSLLSLASSRCGGEITEGKNLKALRNKLFVVNFGAHATLNDNGRIYSRKTEEVKWTLWNYKNIKIYVSHEWLIQLFKRASRSLTTSSTSARLRVWIIESTADSARFTIRFIFHLNHFYFITHRWCSKKSSEHQKYFSDWKVRLKFCQNFENAWI